MKSPVLAEPASGAPPSTLAERTPGTFVTPSSTRDTNAGAAAGGIRPSDGMIQKVSTPAGSMLESGPPRPLFTLTTTSSYEPSPEGQRFLVTAVVSDASPITVILNWNAPSR